MISSYCFCWNSCFCWRTSYTASFRPAVTLQLLACLLLQEFLLFTLLLLVSLKGQCHEIFDFWFFSWISFPQAPEYTIRAVSNFFKNSRRYSQLKVHHRCCWHRWQMEKIFNEKNFNYFVWTLLGSRVNIYINFCLQVHLKVSAVWYCFHYLPVVSLPLSLPPVSLTPAANLPPVSLTPVANLPLISTTLAKLVAKFAAGVIDTGGKFATGVVDTGGAPWLANISASFWKFETVLMGYSGAGENLIHEKNQNQKISWHISCKVKDIFTAAG